MPKTKTYECSHLNEPSSINSVAGAEAPATTTVCRKTSPTLSPSLLSFVCHTRRALANPNANTVDDLKILWAKDHGRHATQIVHKSMDWMFVVWCLVGGCVQHKFENKCGQTKHTFLFNEMNEKSTTFDFSLLTRWRHQTLPRAIFANFTFSSRFTYATWVPLTAVTRFAFISLLSIFHRRFVGLPLSVRCAAIHCAHVYVYSSSQFVMAVIVVGAFLFAKFNANFNMVFACATFLFISSVQFNFVLSQVEFNTSTSSFTSIYRNFPCMGMAVSLSVLPHAVNIFL